jgi:hypothetical protein
MATDRENWEILARSGLGQLKFGDSRAAVDALEDVYGAVTRQASDRIPDSTLQDTLAQFGSDLIDEEKQALLALYAESGPDASSVTEVHGDHGLVLRYEQDRLVEITLSTDHSLSNLSGKNVFLLSAREVLATAESLNKTPGLYHGATAAFPSLGLIFEGFSLTGRQSAPKLLDSSDERFIGRSIGVFERIALDGDGFRAFSWLTP